MRVERLVPDTVTDWMAVEVPALSASDWGGSGIFLRVNGVCRNEERGKGAEFEIRAGHRVHPECVRL